MDVLLAILGSNAITALVTWFVSRPKVAAEVVSQEWAGAQTAINAVLVLLNEYKADALNCKGELKRVRIRVRQMEIMLREKFDYIPDTTSGPLNLDDSSDTAGSDSPAP